MRKEVSRICVAMTVILCACIVSGCNKKNVPQNSLPTTWKSEAEIDAAWNDYVKELIKQDIENGYNLKVQDLYTTNSENGQSVVVKIAQTEHEQSVENNIKVLIKTAMNDEKLDVEVRWE